MPDKFCGSRSNFSAAKDLLSIGPYNQAIKASDYLMKRCCDRTLREIEVYFGSGTGLSETLGNVLNRPIDALPKRLLVGSPEGCAEKLVA